VDKTIFARIRSADEDAAVSVAESAGVRFDDYFPRLEIQNRHLLRAACFSSSPAPGVGP
jgi:hypothetical protein